MKVKDLVRLAVYVMFRSCNACTHGAPAQLCRAPALCYGHRPIAEDVPPCHTVQRLACPPKRLRISEFY